MIPYNDTDDDLVRTHGRVHGNGEQTHVAMLSCGDRAYVAVAYDVRPQDYTPIAADIVAYDPTIEGVRAKAEKWMERNPKGIAPGDDGGGGRGWMRAIVAGAKRLNDYGNSLAEQGQQAKQGQQELEGDK